MNFLAHLLLGSDSPEQALGSVLGDFVKGDLAQSALPPAVQQGVWLHRQIDAFTDVHPVFLQSKARISPQRRRYAGIMIDLFYDHFLARHWASFSAQALPQFTARMYADLAAQEALMPATAKPILQRMAAMDWLGSYADLSSVHTALNNMAVHRLRPGNPLGGAAHELEADYSGFEADFWAFMPQAQGFVQALQQEKGGSNAAFCTGPIGVV